MTTDLQVRKALGKAHLGETRIEEALKVYAGILRDFPEDVEAHLFLGDCYLAHGDGDTAFLYYSQALNLAPDDPDVHRRVRLARTACVQRWAGQTECHLVAQPAREAIPSDPKALASLLQDLTQHKPPVTEGDLFRAGRLLDEIIHNPHPARIVAERLEEVNSLLPALLELNIRQARADGRPDLAQALQNLRDNIQLQKEARSGEGQEATRAAAQFALAGEPAPPGGMWAARPPSTLRILFLEPAMQEPQPRQALLADALQGLGCTTALMNEFPESGVGNFDVVVTRQVHYQPSLLEGLAACSAAKIPILLDLEMDYEHMPVDHPEYERLGLGTPASAKAYATALLLADRILVPSEALAEALKAARYPALAMPDGWTRNNPLWTKAPPARRTVNIGWIGTPGQVDDMAEIRRVVTRIVREFPQTRLVIGGDPQVYHLFDSLPESRRLFLPAVSYDDYPYLLGHLDVLLVPQRNTPFNHTLSDRPLMEASVRAIPWVASPVPAYRNWGHGGLVAHTPDEWHSYLRQLVLDPELRESLGCAGRRQSEAREISLLGYVWLDLIYGALS
jgi:glycosyltransferase involved in cell wall biosynthesis